MIKALRYWLDAIGLINEVKTQNRIRKESDTIEVFISPLFHMLKNRNKAFAQVRKVIFHMGRNFFVIIAGNKSICFQFPKLLCQAGFCNITNMSAKFPETVYILKCDIINNFYFPFTA